MQEFSPIKKRILEYVDYKGITKYEFYKQSHITRGILDQPNGISEDNITRFLAYAPEINLEWLFTGKGEKVNSDLHLNEPIMEYVLRTDKREDLQHIPLYDVEAAAGLVQLLDSKEHVIDYITIPNLPKCDGAIYIKGDSMYPLLKSGDIVMYKRINDVSSGILWGEMYLLSIRLDDEDLTLVKYLQRSELGVEYVKLVSQNQHHSPVDILKTNIRALAYIKASIRINSMS